MTEKTPEQKEAEGSLYAIREAFWDTGKDVSGRELPYDIALLRAPFHVVVAELVTILTDQTYNGGIFLWFDSGLGKHTQLLVTILKHIGTDTCVKMFMLIEKAHTLYLQYENAESKRRISCVSELDEDCDNLWRRYWGDGSRGDNLENEMMTLFGPMYVEVNNWLKKNIADLLGVRETEKEKEELNKWFEKEWTDIDVDNIDTLVHDLASQDASNTNNAGIPEQLDYIYNCCCCDLEMTKRTIREYLADF